VTLLDRLLGREKPTKAVYGGAALTAYLNDVPLSVYNQEPQAKAAAYLKAYKVGWFYKAGKKIADDISSLDWSISEGDMEEGQAESTLDRPDLRTPFDSLRPIDQFQRLLEAPVVDPNTGRVLVTGRQLLRKTQVRLDFAGCAAWYLAGGALGLPFAIHGISPSRLTPKFDQDALAYWMLDDETQNATRFETDEILWFTNGNADNNDIWGTSVVEAVYSQVPLTDLTARHTANVLTTGGRLAGMIWPKNRALDENEFQDAQRAWRNVTSGGDAAKRMLVFPEPMEYASGASTPAEIGIPELAALNRDEIISAFPVGPEMLGVPMPSGMNASGESRRELRRAYWQDTIHVRADLLEETIQVGLLSRYEKIEGRALDFEIAEPNLDDAPTIIEKVGALKGLVAVGFDPKESVEAVGLGHIRWAGLPDLIDPAKQAALAQAAATAPKPDITVSAGDTSRRDAANTQVSVAKAVKPDVPIRAFLTEQRDRIAQKLRDTLPPTKAERKASTGEWWDAAAEDAALQDILETLYREVGREGLQGVADKLNRIVPNKAVANVLSDLIAYGGERITQINEATRQAVAVQLAEGTRRGYSINQIIEGVPGESYPGVQKALLDNGIEAFDAYRAEVIARTETALSLNRSALRGYDEFGVREVQAIDGDGDAECAARNGHTFTVDEALSIEDHPNGTLDWVPVLTKMIHEQPISVAPTFNLTLPETKVYNPAPVVEFKPDIRVEQPVVNVKTAPVDIHVPEPVVNIDVPAPLVSVTNEVQTPEVNVTAPAVNVTNEVQTPTVVNEVPAPVVQITNDVPVPEVTIQAPEVTVNVPDQPAPTVNVNVPKVRRTVERDAEGRITGLTEE